MRNVTKMQAIWVPCGLGSARVPVEHHGLHAGLQTSSRELARQGSPDNAESLHKITSELYRWSLLTQLYNLYSTSGLN